MQAISIFDRLTVTPGERYALQLLGTAYRRVGRDDDARFALLGGTFVGEGALLRFYVLHCVGLPLGIAVLMAVHFWRVRKDGGISGPL